VYSEPCTCPIPPTEINHGYMSKSLLLLVLYTKAGGARLWRSGVGSGAGASGLSEPYFPTADRSVRRIAWRPTADRSVRRIAWRPTADRSVRRIAGDQAPADRSAF
jgi:hypothetical protein